MKKIKLDGVSGNIHFIGIGGVHMSAMAELLLLSGYAVSGSDRQASPATDRLVSLGARVYTGEHRPGNIPEETGLVTYTAAVKSENVELVEAKRRGVALMTRSGLLGEMLKNYGSPICVAGTHGKTSVSSMLTVILSECGLDPSAFIGGKLGAGMGALRSGAGDLAVVESCEYFNSFLDFYPNIGVILNIEADHLDFFKDLEDIRCSFRRFAENCSGALVINAGIERLDALTAGLKPKIVTFGEGGDYRAADISFDEMANGSFSLLYQGSLLARVKLSVPGEHNINNALASLAAAVLCGVTPECAAAALTKYKGAERRFQYRGSFSGVRLIDDYAHHPTEICAAIETAKYLSGAKWFVFQPHTHARTRQLFDEFCACFGNAENIILLDIYSPAGRENPELHIHSLELVEKINARGKRALYLSGFEECAAYLKASCLPGDSVIMMGAGDVNRLAEHLLH